MARRRVQPVARMEQARASLDSCRQWIETLEKMPLSFFEYETLLHHRTGLERELEIAGDPALFAEADELDARFDALTVEVVNSPFSPGSGDGSIPDHRRIGRWWLRLPIDPENRDYTLLT